MKFYLELNFEACSNKPKWRAKRRKGQLEFEKKACKSSKLLQRFLKKANVEGGNEGHEELVAHEGNDDALIGDGNEIEDDDESIRSSLHHNIRQMMLLLITLLPSALTCYDVQGI